MVMVSRKTGGRKLAHKHLIKDPIALLNNTQTTLYMDWTYVIAFYYKSLVINLLRRATEWLSSGHKNYINSK